jgi:hypothetical protein
MSRESSYSYDVVIVPGVGSLLSGAGAIVEAGVDSLATALDSYQETLRNVTAQQLPGDVADSVAPLIALRAAPLLLMEVRARAEPAVAAALDALRETDDAGLVAAGRVPGHTLRQAARAAALVPAAVERLARREHDWLQTVIGSSMRELGYELVPRRRLRAATLEMRARHADGTVISVEADARVGRLSVDLDGFTNGACVAARDRLTSAFARRGLPTRLTAESAHCEIGGQLTQKLDATFGAITRRRSSATSGAARARVIPAGRQKS